MRTRSEEEADDDYITVSESSWSCFLSSFRRMRTVEPTSSNHEYREELANVRLVGPFVFLRKQTHYIDHLSKYIFPLGFLIFNAIYFMFHAIHPDTSH